MNRHLTDTELINYTLKFETDPIRLRLARIMEEMPGCILDDLEDAGMCPDTCTFENTYSPGQYIRHLENEIDYLANERNQLQDELHELKATTLIDFIANVKQELHTAKWSIEESRRVAQREKELRIEAEQKWEMWDKLHHGIRS